MMLNTTAWGCGRAKAMQRIDGFYMYLVGSQLHPLSTLRMGSLSGGKATTHGEAEFSIIVAAGSLDPLLHRSIFKLRTSFAAGQELLGALRRVAAKIN